MEFQQLRYFAAVARLKSFTQAARACKVSQPTLSQQIAKLETELKHSLFERTSRGARLTAVGHTLRERVDQILALLDDALETVSKNPNAGRLAVAAIPTVAPYVLPAIMVEFARTFPDARLDVYELTTDELLDGISKGEVDLGLVATAVRVDSLETEALFTEELLLAMEPNHPLASRAKITFQQLMDTPFVLLSEAHCLTGQTLNLCDRQHLAPIVTAHIQQLSTVMSLVRLGHGVSLVPACAQATTPGLAFRSLADEQPTRTVSCVWGRGRFHNRLMTGFRQLLSSSAAQFTTPARP